MTERKTGVEVQAPAVKMQGTLVIRRADGSIRVEVPFEGLTSLQDFNEVFNDGSPTGNVPQERDCDDD